MKTLRRLIYTEIFSAVFFVLIAFLALFFFFDLLDELPAVGKSGAQGYQLTHALAYSALLIPNHMYELFPICVLIGCVYVMARLAQSSEFTILRTSGLGPGLALKLLLKLGLIFVATTFVVGDYVAPAADYAAQVLKARYQGRITVGQTGAWLREQQPGSNFSANVRALSPDASMSGVRIYEFDTQGRFKAWVEAKRATFAPHEGWVLYDAERTELELSPPAKRRSTTTDAAPPLATAPLSQVHRQRMPEYLWRTELSAEMVSAAVLNPARMKAVDLFQYQRHLQANGQTTQRYEIEFWRKVFYPLSCLVMVVLALPFAYLHFRSGNVTGYVFGGVMAGISFFLLNNVFGFIGNLHNWLPWLASAAPSLIYSIISLAAFGWLVLRH
jgi:lipopolysaccharide export system permease protein